MPKKESEITPKNGKVRLIFGSFQAQRIGAEEIAGLPKPVQTAVVELDELLGWFKSYKVDSIELSIEGSITSGKITNLIVSAGGKGGMKIVLKPIQNQTKPK